MKSASINDLKATLKTKSQPDLLALCLRLARAKKDTKELLSYLLYEADDLAAYIETVKREISAQLLEVNTGNLHWVKKSLRKILRFINKHVRYTGSKTAEVEWRLHFCTALKDAKIPVAKSAALLALHKGQLQKIDSVIATLHDDLQRDYSVQRAAVAHLV